MLNIFTAFGYLETQDEDQQVLKQVSKALKPNGLFLLETLHREMLIRHFSSHMIEHYPEGLIVLEERDFDLLTSRTNVKLTVIYQNGERKEYGHAARVYIYAHRTGTNAELSRLTGEGVLRSMG